MDLDIHSLVSYDMSSLSNLKGATIMSIRRSTFVMSGDSFFEPGVPIYVNRAYETFELNAHSHEFIEITYISEGAGVHYIDDEAVPVEHGTLFLSPLGAVMYFDLRPR